MPSMSNQTSLQMLDPYALDSCVHVMSLADKLLQGRQGTLARVRMNQERSHWPTLAVHWRIPKQLAACPLDLVFAQIAFPVQHGT